MRIAINHNIFIVRIVFEESFCLIAERQIIGVPQITTSNLAATLIQPECVLSFRM